MFTPHELTEYLHMHIPVSAAMQVRAEVVDWDRLALVFPLAPNLNHNSTAFGGSLSSALMLAGWSMTHNRLRHLGYDTALVVSRSETRFLAPVASDFVATCEHSDDEAWSFFRECLDRKGRAKLRVSTQVCLCDQPEAKPAATMTGAFVAIRRDYVETD